MLAGLSLVHVCQVYDSGPCTHHWHYLTKLSVGACGEEQCELFLVFAYIVFVVLERPPHVESLEE